ncbi:PHP domain-containing protein [Thermotalea metallivorans]|uniref:Phosphoribosyl 1,2-cyclic phosphate 1,2-diphosphodiesterase n=1 Tax=Thermotalea metallivorans TaxID=520762 RepID=A0A140L5J1_9FIRM|nr:PHP domain-containing protein [Thermotalea metallivorans]KXG75816.1 Phosphoribosyl 1,2-cyclic phosphate 1,2-diphosphodiesterase [Thermotalea metallivorans]
MIIDMHVHSTASDGVLSPSEIIHWAVRLGLKGVAITDHDTVDGIQEAIVAAREYDHFIFIPGIEFSTQQDDHEIHILGYFIDHLHQDILQLTEKIKEDRLQRGIKMIKKLAEIGYEVTFEEVLSLSQDGVVGRPHIGRLLVKKGYVASVQEAFDKLLDKGKAAYVERFKLTPYDAIDTIKKGKGIPVLAHPGLIDRKVNILDIIRNGIQGIEVYHSKHGEADTAYCLNLAKNHGLLVTGGSDYHDTFIAGKPAIGSIGVPYETIAPWIEGFRK